MVERGGAQNWGWKEHAMKRNLRNSDGNFKRDIKIEKEKSKYSISECFQSIIDVIHREFVGKKKEEKKNYMIRL